MVGDDGTQRTGFAAAPDRTATRVTGAGRIGRSHAEIIARRLSNATLAAMLGYVTLEFAPAPSDEPDRWAKEFQQALEALPDVARLAPGPLRR